MKGLCKIQLIDNETGRIVKETQDENMVTAALNRVLNPPPIFFAESTSNDYYNYIHRFLESPQQPLGGVILWSEQIPEDANTIFPPNPSAQVGYAGDDAYTGDNPFRGSYNTAESGQTDTGCKFVWDFPTSQANGTIRCVTLTSAKGGCCGWGGSFENPMDTHTGTMVSIPTRVSGMPDYVFSGFFVGMYKENTLTFAKKLSAKELEIRDVEFPVYSINTKSRPIFSDSVKRSYSNEKVVKLTSEFRLGEPYSFFRSKDFFVSCYSINYVDIEYVKFDANSIPLQKKITLPNGRRAYLNSYAELNGFLYLLSAEGAMLYKISIDNPADITDIQLPIFERDTWRLFVFENQIAFINDGRNEGRKGWFITADDELVPTSIDKEYIEAPFIKAPFYLSERRNPNSVNVSANLIKPYLATIDNLASPVTKTASQSMKVIYTLTDI